MELIIEGIPIIMTVTPATGDKEPRLLATIKDSDVVYSCSLYLRLSKAIETTNNVYESLRKAIASNDKHLLTAKFTDNYYISLKVEAQYYYGNSMFEFTRECTLEKGTLQQIRRAMEKHKKASINMSNHKLLERIEDLTERIAKLEAHVLK